MIPKIHDPQSVRKLWDKACEYWLKTHPGQECNMLRHVDNFLIETHKRVLEISLPNFLIDLQRAGWRMHELKILANHCGFEVYESRYTLSVRRWDEQD